MKRFAWILMAALTAAPGAWACGKHDKDKDKDMAMSGKMMSSLPGPEMESVADEMAQATRDLQKAARVNANNPNLQRTEMLAIRSMDQLAERADDLRDAIEKHGSSRMETADEYQELVSAYYGMMRTMSYQHAPDVMMDELRPVQNLMASLTAYYGGLGSTMELEHRSNKLVLKEDEGMDYSELKAEERAKDGVLIARSDVQ